MPHRLSSKRLIEPPSTLTGHVSVIAHTNRATFSSPDLDITNLLQLLAAIGHTAHADDLNQLALKMFQDYALNYDIEEAED